MPRTPRFLTLLLWMLAACSPSQQARNEALTPSRPAEADSEREIGPAGGVVELEGASLDVPAGALSEDVAIRVERFGASEVPKGYLAASSLYRFQPSGLTFDEPAEVRLPITGPVAGARLYWSNGHGGFDVVSDATVEDGVMVGAVEHFSFGFVGRAVDVGGEEVCAGASTCQELLHPRTDKFDLLLVVDNSTSMAEEQAALSRELPRMVTALTTGDLDGDGVQDVQPIGDLHVGAVSTDMGLVGIEGINHCEGFGGDGRLQTGASGSCDGASLPTFLSYDGTTPAQQVSDELACIASLGTEGCGFEQQLEAALKALTVSDSEIEFLADASGAGAEGQADRFNEGFLRSDARDPSMVAVVLVTDEEDCSSFRTDHFAPPMALDPDDPLRSQDLNLRCFLNSENLYPVERYVDGLKALRPDNDNLVFFAAIVGVPVDLVDADALRSVDLGVAAEREAFYRGLLDDARMREQVDESLLVGSRTLVPSCRTETGTAYPPRRIVEVARGFGANAMVQSICQDDFGPVIQPIIERMTAQLGGACTEVELNRDDGGRVACELRVQLPTGAACDDMPFATAIAGASDLCTLAQLPVTDAQVPAGDGWYLDDFSVRARLCPGSLDQAIVLSAEVDLMPGARAFLTCP